MSEKFEAFMLNKESEGHGVVPHLPDMTGLLPYLAVGAPIAAGVGGGYLASRMTSPTEDDSKSLQKEMLLSKIEREIAKRQREQAVEESASQVAPVPKRKIDPFTIA